jgi:3-deoxy-D-manno-octulosonic-acid transferase
MFYLYSTLLTLAFVALSPLLAVRREKYAAGFSERMGRLEPFGAGGARVVWLHCVSVGETNAALSLVDLLRKEVPEVKLVVSTTNATGRELAGRIFEGKADRIFYFPFDWAFAVRRALRVFRPHAVLLMETEIWPNFIREAKRSGAKVAIVNGRLSQKSFDRYSKVGFFLRRVLSHLDLALMQAPRDRDRIVALGVPEERALAPGNLKFDQKPLESHALTEEIRSRFGFGSGRPLIIAASTHAPEEEMLVGAYSTLRRSRDARLMLAPRHPQRFDAVFAQAGASGFRVARRSDPRSDGDSEADIVILDSIGELRAVYPLAEVVFCGGSLIPHGGQSILEPAVEGRATVTGPFTHNFADAVEVFTFHDGLIGLSEDEVADAPSALARVFGELLSDDVRRAEIGRNARGVMDRNRGAAERTLADLRRILDR